MYRLLKVHSIYDKVLNAIDDDGVIVTITSINSKLLPSMIIIKNYNSERFNIGDELRIDNDKLINSRNGNVNNIQEVADDNDLQIENYVIDILEILKKYGNLDNALINNTLRNEIVKIADNKVKDEGLYLLLTDRDNTYTKFLKDKIDAFVYDLKKDIYDDEKIFDEDKYNKYGEKLIGCGIGLTPSSDDTLTGIMFSIFIGIIINGFKNSFDEKWIFEKIKITKNIFKCFISKCKFRTTDVSYNFLKFASDGYFSDDLYKLINCILYSDFKNIFRIINDIADYGSTSGLDILTGIVIANK